MAISKIDFYVSFQDDPTKLNQSMLSYAWLARNKAGKNTFVAHTGESREGKSSNTIYELDFMLAERGISIKKHIHDIMVYTPFEYPEKLQNILYEKPYKEIPFLVLDDSRFVVGAKNWQSFSNRAIANVASISGRIKPITLILNTLFLGDIDKEIRLMLNFWGSTYRPLSGPSEMRYYRFWLDEIDPERLRLRKRKFKGIVLKGKKPQMYEPKKFVFPRPQKEIWKMYDEESYRAKGRIIQKKLDELLVHMKKQIGINDRIEALINFYSDKEFPERYNELMEHFEFKYKKLRLRKEANEVLGLSKEDAREFTQRISEKFRKNEGVKKNVISSELDAKQKAG